MDPVLVPATLCVQWHPSCNDHSHIPSAHLALRTPKHDSSPLSSSLSSASKQHTLPLPSPFCTTTTTTTGGPAQIRMHATPRQRQPMPMKRVFPSDDDENITDNTNHIPQPPASATPTAARVRSVFTTPPQAPGLPSPTSPVSEQLRREQEQEYKRLRVEVETQRKKAGKSEASGVSGERSPAETENNTVEEKHQGVESFGSAQGNGAGEPRLEQSIQPRLAEFRKQLETMTEYFESLKSNQAVDVEDSKRLEERMCLLLLLFVSYQTDHQQ